MLTFIDLFCGIGGFRLGLERCGLRCVFSSEINPQARLAYEANFGESPAGDITQINAQDIPPHDIITAGFPCQSFSIAGHREGFDDPRGQLFFEIVRIAKHHQPKLLLLENVGRLKTAENGAILNRITSELDSIGYYLTFAILNASDYGIPQARKRWFGVAMRKDCNLTWQAPPPSNELCSVGDIMEDDKDIAEDFYVRNKVVITHPHNLHRRGNEVIRVGHILRLDDSEMEQTSQGYRVYSDNGIASTQGSHFGGVGARTGLYVKAGQGIALFSKKGVAGTQTASKCYRASSGVYYTNNKARPLTNKEMQAVMGFPAEHVVGESYHGRSQLGNAVIPKMAELVYLGLGKGLI